MKGLDQFSAKASPDFFQGALISFSVVSVLITGSLTENHLR